MSILRTAADWVEQAVLCSPSPGSDGTPPEHSDVDCHRAAIPVATWAMTRGLGGISTLLSLSNKVIRMEVSEWK
jgi:hypothetical protein